MHSTVLTLQGSSTPLYGASFEGRLNVVQILLDHGADVNQTTGVSNCLHNNYPHCMYVATDTCRQILYLGKLSIKPGQGL